MKKKDIISDIAEETRLPVATVSNIVNRVVDHIIFGIANGGRVTLVGLGKFFTRDRAQRSGVNPRTGERITVPASRTIKFIPGKTAKDAVKGKGKV